LDKNIGNWDNPVYRNSNMSFVPSNRLLSATATNLSNTLNTIETLADENDHFFFYSFDHGGGSYNASGTFGEEVLNGWGQDIRDDQLVQWLDDIDAGYSTYVFAECFAGGMLDDFGNLGDGQFGAAATNHYEYSYGDGFANAVVNAFNAGYRSTHGLFQYALQHDPYAASGWWADNGGGVVYGREHPWSIGTDFWIFGGIDNNPIEPWIQDYRGPVSSNAVAPSFVFAGLTDLTDELPLDAGPLPRNSDAQGPAQRHDAVLPWLVQDISAAPHHRLSGLARHVAGNARDHQQDHRDGPLDVNRENVSLHDAVLDELLAPRNV
jgi:hypothetical protein